MEDIFSILSLVKTQTDLLILKESDYIHYPKESGYKSYHMVLGIPVYRIEGMQYYPVEIQFRTLAMDLWASMEHRICYKGRPLTKPLMHFATILENSPKWNGV